jgi:hypothetical protein
VNYYYCSAIGNKENKEKMISFLKEYKECINKPQKISQKVEKISLIKPINSGDLDKVKQSLYTLIEKDEDIEGIFESFYAIFSATQAVNLMLNNLYTQLENSLSLRNFVFVDINDVEKRKITGINYENNDISYELVTNVEFKGDEKEYHTYTSIFALGLPIIIGRSPERKQLKYWIEKNNKGELLTSSLFSGSEEEKYLFEEPLFFILHETVEVYIVGKLMVDGPYERWFTEGVANFLAYEIIKEVKGSDYAKNIPYSLESIDKEYLKYRKKVNLPNWLAVTYERMYDKDINKELTTAHYAYATQLIGNFFENKDNVKKVLDKLKEIEGTKDTLIIDSITQQLFSKSIKEELYKYKTKKTLKPDEEEKYLLKLGRELFDENKNFLKIRKLSQKLIEFNPLNYNAHLYYYNGLYQELINNPDDEELRNLCMREWYILDSLAGSNNNYTALGFNYRKNK